MSAKSDFWQWFREYVVRCAATKFQFIHPAEMRVKACEAFNLRSVPDWWAWCKKNRATIAREANRAAKPLGLKFQANKGPNRYSRLVKL